MSFGLEGRGRTSSSTRVIRACRYSSIVMWKASVSFKLTGTIFFCFSKTFLVLMFSNNSCKKETEFAHHIIPSRISPTSSIVRSRPV